MALPFFEFLSHLMHLDLFWFIDLVMNNMAWVFMWAAVGYFIMGKNKMVLGGIFICISVWIVVSFTNLIGWIVLSGTFLSMHYLVRLTLMAFTEQVDALKPYFLLILSLQFVVTLAIFNLFMGG